MKSHDPYLRLGPLRWPPRVATSLQYGLMAYFAVLLYGHGMTRTEVARHVVDGYMEFWGQWGATGLWAGAAVILVAILWILYDNWRLLGRMV